MRDYLHPGLFGNVIDPAIQRYLAAHVRRRRGLAVLQAIGAAIVLGVTTSLVACLMDRLIAIPAVVRASALVLTAAFPLVVLARPISRLFRRVDPVAAAAAIERQHPGFAHRLVTAASVDGSVELRAMVEREVLDLIVTTGPARVPRRPAGVALLAAVSAIAVFALLWRWPWLDLPDLTRRLVHPTAAIAAVTTTRLSVQPGQCDVVEGRSLTVTASVSGKVGSAGVALHVSEDRGQSWFDRTMSPTSGIYAATLADIDRDLVYTVTAGDAVSPIYAVHVRRVPAVVTFRVRLDYPPRLHRAAVSSSDPAIEAPSGTTVTLVIVATVPLQRATLTLGADRIEMDPMADPCARRAQFVVHRDNRMDLQLVSTDGVPGTGPRTARVRARPIAPSVDVPGYEDQARAYRRALQGGPTTRTTLSSEPR